ncbi:MAG: prepilin-type N-terminal cleavage/methylation domain-containing protein [Patescibacteria group bacterium]
MKVNRKAGFSLIEVILSSAIFALLVTAIVGGIIYGRESTAVSGSRARAIAFAEEGIEAVRNLRDQNFGNLTDGTHGLTVSLGQWFFSGTSDVNGIFTRQISIGTLNENAKNITSTVTWPQTPSRPGSIVLSGRLTNWRAPKPRGGMLVYRDGATTPDFIRYKTLDSSGVWSGASLAADVDSATTNKIPRATQVYSSATRNEKVMISRHLAGTNGQTIYAQVYDGLSWGNVVLLSSWTSNTLTDVQNFSGAYLQNGDFMTVYSDNTAVPKFRVWNGVSWQSQVSLPSVGGTPAFIVIKNRSGTNEVAAAFFDSGSDTNTLYFNGGAYLTASWTSLIEHATTAPFTNRRLVDFTWSPSNPLKGLLIYGSSAGDRTINARVWTANGTGGGSWSASVDSTSIGTNLSSLAISGRATGDEFIACKKDSAATPDIYCFRNNISNVWSNPGSQTITTVTDAGIQRSFDIAYEPATGGLGLIVYSDNTTVPKLKKYNPVSNSWDAAPTNLNTLGGSLEVVRLIPHPDTDDILILLADTNQDSYSLIWNGVLDSIYSTPAGKTFTAHSISGSTDTDFWFDFAWDKF